MRTGDYSQLVGSLKTIRAQSMDKCIHGGYSDCQEHAALVQRILRVDESTWKHLLSDYRRRLQGSDVDSRLLALRESWEVCSPHAGPLPSSPVSRCPVCIEEAVRPILCRLPSDVYGLCSHCGHGVLLSQASPSIVYGNSDYYTRQTANRVGYEDYRCEQRYREEKASRLFDWIAKSTVRPIRSMLEVGSGYGFSRAAAERRGWRTFGVDLNPHAAEAAHILYGFDTFVGTLEQALTGGAVVSCAWDLVLYQFVLEHIVDPSRELQRAVSSMAPQGLVAMLVPSMQAFERVVFGASYRSIRPDHLHLFSWDSLDRCLAAAGLDRIAWSSECSVHLLADFFTQNELESIYQRGDGPDLVALAAKEQS